MKTGLGGELGIVQVRGRVQGSVLRLWGLGIGIWGVVPVLGGLLFGADLAATSASITCLSEEESGIVRAAGERRGKNWKSLKDFCLKDEAIIWP